MKTLAPLCALVAFIAWGTAAYADVPSGSFDVGSIHVDKYAAVNAGGSALILIPGATNNASVWDATIQRFAPSHAIYALTLAGFGGRPAVTAPMLDKATADIAALIEKEHIDKPVVIGHSLGGHLALRLAAEHGAMLRAAVAVDGLPVYPGYEAMTAEQRSAAAVKTAAQISSAATSEQLTSLLRAYIIPYMTLPKNVDTVVKLSAGADVAATAQYMRELLSDDSRPQLSRIGVPVLEIAPYDSALDGNPPLSFATAAAKQTYYEALLKNDKTATVKMIEGSRHYVMYDQPDAFYATLDAFLATLK